MLTFAQALSLIASIQLILIIAFLLINKKGKRLSNYLLAGFFITLLIGFLDGLLIHYRFWKNPDFALILNGFVLLNPPFLLLYTYSLTRKNFRLTAKHLFHVIPFLIGTFLLIKYYHLQSEEVKTEILEGIDRGTQLPFIMIAISGLIYVLIYLFGIKLEIRRYRRRLKRRFSNIKNINLSWLNFIANLYIVALLLSNLGNAFRYSHFELFTEFGLILACLGLFFFINSILLKGLYQNKIFISDGGSDQINTLESIDKEQLTDRLFEYMEKEKPYLNPDLTINQLAEQLNISVRQLSQLINEELNQSFFDFINRHRIEAAVEELKNPVDQNQTVLEVMYRVGFNSKSSFNTAFKKYTGTTPSSFKK